MNDFAVTIRTLTSDALRAAIPDLARLRCEVFAAWPYLYQGDDAYEAEYLREFAVTEGAVLIAASDGAHIIGAATASPMTAQPEEYQAGFRDRGIDVASLYYFGESVVLPAYRGRGIGHAFFDHREEQARRHGATATTFCGVIRPADHPARPADYVPLDQFWQKRGYAMVPGLIARFSWPDIGDDEETEKPMQYWMRQL